MSCQGCAAKFGFLCKEHACPACGFSFCSSCLKYKTIVPKLDNKLTKVCKSCFQLGALDDSKSKVNAKNKFAPPDIFLRRLETLDTPPKPPITIYHDRPRLQQLLQGLNSTDLEIALRLKKLRDDRRNARHVPTEEEIASRLAKLRDQDSNEASNSPSTVYFAPETRSVVEQTDHLLKQTVEATALDSKFLKPEDEIAEKLRQLRQRNKQDFLSMEVGTKPITLDEVAELLSQCKMEAGEGGARPDLATIVSLEKLRTRLTEHKDNMEQESPSDDEDSAVQKIIAKASAEAELEQRLGMKVDESEEMDDDQGSTENELPWCVICNEDACVRCLDCDRDLYCRDCFQQGHKDADMRDHIFEPFKQK